MKTSVGSCFKDAAQGKWLGFRRIAPVWELLRLSTNSCSPGLTTSPQALLPVCPTVVPLRSEYCALYPLAEARGLTAFFDNSYFQANELLNKIQSLIDNYKEPCPSAHEFYDRLVCEQCGLVEGF